MTKNKNKLRGLSDALQAFDEDLAVEVPGYAKTLAAERETEASVDAQCKAIRAMFAESARAKGLTQGELAARMGVMQPAINKIENGDGDIGIKTLLRYAAALEDELSVGFSEPEDPSQHPPSRSVDAGRRLGEIPNSPSPIDRMRPSELRRRAGCQDRAGRPAFRTGRWSRRFRRPSPRCSPPPAVPHPAAPIIASPRS